MTSDAGSEPAHPRGGQHRKPGATRAGAIVVLVVAVGGALGALARWGMWQWWATPAHAFPWTTLVINVLGCLVMGAFKVFLAQGRVRVDPLWDPFFGTGVLGGFTTFSTYCVDIQQLTHHDEVGRAIGYLVATPVAALAAVFAGTYATRRILRTGSGER